MEVKEVLVLEDVNDSRTQHGISFNGHNPLGEDYFECISFDEAVRLANKINQLNK